MADRELEEFKRRLADLKQHSSLREHLRGDRLRIGELDTTAIQALIKLDEGHYFMIAAASLSRTTLKKAMQDPDAQLVSPKLRRAHAIRERLPAEVRFSANCDKAVSLRARDFIRRKGGGTEALFRDRLVAEGIPMAMSPPLKRVPGLLVAQRKPDGVFPDPATGLPPQIYLEIKKVRRVSDDIQKRLYEIAEVALEMKFIYGDLRLEGQHVASLDGVAGSPELRQRLREQISRTGPIIVALLLCPRAEAEKYRAGGEAFIDRIFFQEEIEECIAFLRQTIAGLSEAAD